MSLDELANLPPFGVDKTQKGRVLYKRLLELTRHHIAKCPNYARMMKGMNFAPEGASSYYDIPFLPVSLFKQLELKSIPPDEVFRLMTSSGTMGHAVSKIYLDKGTASAQQRFLVKIVSDFIGTGRVPMLIIDCPSVLKNCGFLSARGAGILGFSIFGAGLTYALGDDMKLNLSAVEAFCKKHQSQKILMFGFTFMIWKHFYAQLLELKKNGKRFDFSQAVLIHGGGWKKLESESVSKQAFKQGLQDVCGISDIHDYYGMAEQTGTIYMECDKGHLHASAYSDVIMRRARDFSVCEIGERGIIQVLSALPESYPGHSLLTEDEGAILGEDDCPCGRKGKYFEVYGRLKNAEIRGCSDTFASGDHPA